jgi:hypothetical protein
MRPSGSWTSRFLARSSPASSLAAGSCSFGRDFAFDFFQPRRRRRCLVVWLRLPPLVSDQLLSSDELTPMPGTLGPDLGRGSQRRRPRASSGPTFGAYIDKITPRAGIIQRRLIFKLPFARPQTKPERLHGGGNEHLALSWRGAQRRGHPARSAPREAGLAMAPRVSLAGARSAPW